MRVISICLLLFMFGCVMTPTEPAVMCPAEDAVITITRGDQSYPVIIGAGFFDGDYMTVEQFEAAVEAQKARQAEATEEE